MCGEGGRSQVVKGFGLLASEWWGATEELTGGTVQLTAAFVQRSLPCGGRKTSGVEEAGGGRVGGVLVKVRDTEDRKEQSPPGDLPSWDWVGWAGWGGNG